MTLAEALMERAELKAKISAVSERIELPVIFQLFLQNVLSLQMRFLG